MKGVVTSAGSEYMLKHNAPATRDADCLAIAVTKRPDRGKNKPERFAVAPSGITIISESPETRSPGDTNSFLEVRRAGQRWRWQTALPMLPSERIPRVLSRPGRLLRRRRFEDHIGLVSTKGVFPIEARHLDTVGPIVKDVAHVVEGWTSTRWLCGAISKCGGC